ncbi:MAG: phosphoenolpyruvate carboxykinase (ATP), partial [Chloroflexi bacterium]|nr:phosphoenolpyruvate carboxykinase (ATP) [Chloroflexota bacterium]
MKEGAVVETLEPGVVTGEPSTLAQHGLDDLGGINWNLGAAVLCEETVRRREGVLAETGPLIVRTGKHTGRSPRDRFLVHEPSSADHIGWGPFNHAFDADRFASLHAQMAAYLRGREVLVQDCFAGADPEYRLPIRVITELAWHSLFARNLFRVPTPAESAVHSPAFTVIDAPGFAADPQRDGTRSGTFILVDFSRRTVLIGGTAYAGEIKKSIFSVLNYVLPRRGVLSMHCSANAGPRGDVALFFGLSGTGKTTLSSDQQRVLIGDDEHGWRDRGVFNFEGGCYAKTIRLSQEAEPQIYEAVHRFGTVLENVGFDPVARRLDFDDESLTENTRAAYPLHYIANASATGVAGHPRTVVFLAADAFGVLPPVSRLTPEQAMYHFLSGYTAKVAGTEQGVVEPQATFSTCFGAPFMVLPPHVYASMLGERIARHRAAVWLVNTGWSDRGVFNFEGGCYAKTI